MNHLLEFDERLPYRYDDRGRQAPIVPVRVFLALALPVDVLCVIDTGAERTLLDGQLLRAAGRDLFAGTPRRVGGFLGSSALVYEHAVRLQLAGLEIEMDVLFSSQPLARQVIGRDILEHLRLGLREHRGEMYFAGESGA